MFGAQDSSYQAAGAEPGIRALCTAFYRHMDREPQASTIRSWHKDDLDDMADRLASFVCGWLGGPRLYSEKFGPISIPGYHQQFDIGEAERDAWIHCMDLAIEEQNWDADFKRYLKAQFRIPAERCRSR